MVLAGDIGGTKTVLALFSEEKGPHEPIQKKRFSSREFNSLDDIVTSFIAETHVIPSAATFGVAGPVSGQKVRVTNLPWQIDAVHLSQSLRQIPVYLLNDLEAIAYAIPMLEGDDLVPIRAGVRDATGPIAVIAPGTGLGEAFLFWDGQRYRAIPSEGGHTDFAPATQIELELLTYLMTELGHVSYERVCSGMGIQNLYRFLRNTGRFEEPGWLAEDLATVDDVTPVIVEAALNQRSELCKATLDLFVAILGSEAGNLVLQVLATGGVYLGGGIPPKILPKLKDGQFVEAFHRKGRFADMLKQVPVDVIINPEVALFGSANHCFTMAQSSANSIN